MVLIILKVYQHVHNIHLEGTVSRNYFSRFHKIKSRTYIKNLRDPSLQMNVFCRCVKFDAWGTISKGDILVKKIKVNNFEIP